jgi:hypothetical protein
MMFYITGRINVLLNHLNNYAMNNPPLRVMVKKRQWHTSYGNIKVEERLFRVKGKQYSPFSTSANTYNRACSMILQRIVVDFGADHAFG